MGSLFKTCMFNRKTWICEWGVWWILCYKTSCTPVIPSESCLHLPQSKQTVLSFLYLVKYFRMKTRRHHLCVFRKHPFWNRWPNYRTELVLETFNILWLLSLRQPFCIGPAFHGSHFVVVSTTLSQNPQSTHRLNMPEDDWATLHTQVTKNCQKVYLTDSDYRGFLNPNGKYMSFSLAQKLQT